MRQFSDSRQPPADGHLTASASMRRLIRSKTSKQFLTKDGGWTDQLEIAAEFPDPSGARAAAQQHNLREVVLYYSFSEHRATDYDFSISLL